MDNSSQLMPFRKTTGQILRSLKIYILKVVALVQSGRRVQEMIIGVQLTLLTVEVLDQEILIQEEM
jgi:hypothetical protein